MLILILIFITVLLIAHHYNHKHIIFYSSDDIITILNDTFKNYYNNMNDTNINLRQITNKEVFLKNLYKCFYNCNQYDKYLLIEAIHTAQKKMDLINCIGFYPNKLKNIPWKLGFSYLYDYEFGLPHTHNDIIILNKNNIYDDDLVTILIHERIHIYQKLFPNDIQEYLKHNNFKKIIKKSDNDIINPDTDEYIYERNGLIYECKIDNNKLKFTKHNSKYEHPFEYMAYTLSESC